MCGIAGIVGPSVGQVVDPIVDSMLVTLDKRGPDERGWTAFPNCILAHTRLSILDLATGHQPMRDNERNTAITFNGEIYNFQELRDTLSAKGYKFSTRSDTEVILKAYLEYGVDCPQHLDGMFAFGIWDEAANTLFLARDRFGKKPLYYAFDEHGNLVFASEIKTLFASGRIRGTVDFGALDSYLRLGYVPPLRTVYQNIRVVEPGETLVFRSEHVSRRKYWTIRHAPIKAAYAEAKEEVRRLLQDAIRKRMVADVEIGALLSGGVDSTIVTSIAQSCSPRPIKTFSVGYGDYINELPYSQAAADKIGTDHHVLQVGGDGLVDELKNVAAYFDEPHADTSNVSQCLVSRLARTKVKVALCGDGGDEAFLGYDWYWRHLQQGRRQRLKRALFTSPFHDYIESIQIFRAAHRKGIWNGRPPDTSEFLTDEMRWWRLGPVKRMNVFDLTVYLPGQLLVKGDRAGMMNSLEVRSPLLDHALVEYVFNLPLEYKTDRNGGKRILKDLLREVMPAEFVDRKKQGFGAPVLQWLRTICQPLVRDLFARPNADVYGIMNRNYIEQMIERFYSGRDSSDYLRIWTLLCLELWFNGQKHAHAGRSDESGLAAVGRLGLPPQGARFHPQEPQHR
jgi:asparagine synthase (glutamine-hydrolysing)